MLRLIRGSALVALAAVVLVAVLYGPLTPYSNRTQQTIQDFESWYAARAFATTTALVASFTAGVLALITAWEPRRRAWMTLLAVGLVLDAYIGSLLNVLTLVSGNPDGNIYGAAGGLVEWLSLLAAPAWPAVVALAYAIRFRAEAAPYAVVSPAPDDDPLELHYGPLRGGEKRA